ncbi:M20 family metallopeptidase [Lachnospiraceae bacterium 45-P1]
MDNKKQKIVETVEAAREDLLKLSKNIHDNPELGFEEFKAVDFISETLENHGFSVEKGYGGLPTSFRADAKGNGDGPTVAFLAEYDALNGIGHGCGHNLIATCAVGAFLGLSSLLDSVPGRICIIGTPAEEGGAGKVKLLANGAFDDVDYALMMHPSGGGSNLVGRGGRAACTVKVSFRGKGAHSSAPQNGINALSAVISVFNQIDMARPTFDPQDNINGIISDGGTASNIIPAFASCAFCLRADTMKRIEDLIQLIKTCVANAERLTGAKGEVTWDDISAERYPSKPICQAFKDNMHELGIEMTWPDPKKQYGSSDIGNVSIKIPAIHDYLSITDDASIQAHTVEYTEAAASPEAQEVCLKGAKGLAMTAYDILSNPEFQKEIREFHDKQIPEFYKK